MTLSQICWMVGGIALGWIIGNLFVIGQPVFALVAIIGFGLCIIGALTE